MEIKEIGRESEKDHGSPIKLKLEAGHGKQNGEEETKIKEWER
jgi:hypothetical protein